jgi:methanogenic corrinoid protein MtbC1
LGSSTTDDSEVHIDQLITAMIDLEEESFISVLSSITGKIGFEKAVTTIFYPFLHKIGILWHTGNITPAQEHFITHLIRQKMIVAIDQLPIPSKTKKKAVLFLPENEFHEIALLFYHYVTRKIGFRTYYLGQTVPLNDLKSIYKIYKPTVIITCITTSPEPKELPNYVSSLCHVGSASQILITGSALAKINLKKEENLHLFKNAKELQELLQGL